MVAARSVRAGGALPPCNVYGLSFSSTSYFFPTLLGVSSVVQLLFLLLWFFFFFFSGFCHVRENGFFLERLIAARIHFFSEKLVHKKRGFVGQHESKTTSNAFQ